MAKLISSIVTKFPSFLEASVKYGKPRLETFIQYAKVELVPPKPNEFGQVAQGFGNLLKSAKSGTWKQQTVKEATLNTLIGLEVVFVFFIGECIGKWHFVGYNV